MTTRINADWLIGEDEEFKKYLFNQADNVMLKKFRKLIRRKLDMTEKSLTSSKVYDRAGWEGYMAHQNGIAEMAAYVLDLLGHMEKK